MISVGKVRNSANARRMVSHVRAIASDAPSVLSVDIGTLLPSNEVAGMSSFKNHSRQNPPGDR